MKLGVLTGLFVDWELEKVLKFISDIGYQAVELMARPGIRHVDVDYILNGGGEEVKRRIAACNLELSALTCHVNLIDPNPDRRRKLIEHFEKVIKCAHVLGAPVVTATPGTLGRDVSFEENLREFRKVFEPLVKLAAECDVKIGIEAFPDNFVYNIPTTEAMLNEVKADNFGLNFDPSHYVWQMIDYMEYARRFSDKIFHTHAKDCEILPEQLRLVGIQGRGWWRWRIPGWGEIDWKRLVTLYKEIGYDFVISFEQHDKLLSNEESVRKTLHYLKNLI